MKRLLLMGCLALLVAVPLLAAARKVHSVVLGAARKVAYSRVGDPAGASADERELRIRALIVDGVVKEWTTGDAHDVTDRSFVVRRALRINDTLPGDKQGQWVWQRGPWLMVDRVSGHVTALRLPDYDPGVSQVAWFRDYAAYCGVPATAKNLYAIVWQVGGRRPVLNKKLDGFDVQHHADPVCGPVDWQREPMKAVFHPTGRDEAGFAIVPGSAVLVEDSADDTQQADSGDKEAAPAAK